MKASDLLGHPVYDSAGVPMGRIVDLLARPDEDGRPRVYAALVTPGHRGRLLGYERPGIQGPWLMERLAGWLHRATREVAWSDLRLGPPDHG